MRMAAVAGVLTILVTDMAGHAFRIVVTIQYKIFVVLERRWHPLLLGVALAAIAGNFLVQCISWWLMASLAFLACLYFEQGVVKTALRAKALDASVVAMTSNTVLFQERVMERCAGQWLFNGLSQGRDLAYFC